MKNKQVDVVIGGKPCIAVVCAGGRFLIEPSQQAQLDTFPNAWRINAESQSQTFQVTSTLNGKPITLQHYLVGKAADRPKLFIDGDSLNFCASNLRAKSKRKAAPPKHYAKQQKVEPLDAAQLLREWQAHPERYVLWKPRYHELLRASQTNSETAQALVNAILSERIWSQELCDELTRLEKRIHLRDENQVIDLPLSARIASFQAKDVMQRLRSWDFSFPPPSEEGPLPKMRILQERHGLSNDQVQGRIEQCMRQEAIRSKNMAKLFVRSQLANAEERQQWYDAADRGTLPAFRKYRLDVQAHVFIVKAIAKQQNLGIAVDLGRIVTQPCLYCGERTPGQPVSGAGRLDHSIGYQVDNTVPACAFCRTAQGSWSVENFLRKTAEKCAEENPDEAKRKYQLIAGRRGVIRAGIWKAQSRI